MLLCRQSNFPGITIAKTCRGEHHKPNFLFGFPSLINSSCRTQAPQTITACVPCVTQTETRKCKITSASFLFLMLLLNRNCFCFISQCTITTTLGWTLDLFLLLLWSINVWLMFSSRHKVRELQKEQIQIIKALGLFQWCLLNWSLN